MLHALAVAVERSRAIQTLNSKIENLVSLPKVRRHHVRIVEVSERSARVRPSSS